jgi:nitroreductase
MLTNVEDTIRKRFSCRNFQSKCVDITTKQNLELYLSTEKTDTFEFFVEYSSRYHRDYIISCLDSTQVDSVTFGFHFERIVLTCTQMDLATCWTGIFPQHHFKSLVPASNHPSVGMITPIGYPTSIPPKKPKKSWNELFFYKRAETPLDPSVCPLYQECLEMVRIGPSAMNLQPWRILYDGTMFHFFLQRTTGLIGLGFQTLLLDLQKVDMGIALCHFELTAKERGLTGEWIVSSPEIPSANWEYIQSWKC